MLLVSTSAAAELNREKVLSIIDRAGNQPPKLSNKNLSGLDLSGVDFKGADLFSANLG